MIRFVSLFFSLVIMLDAKVTFEVQLYATKISNDKNIDILINRGATAGLNCYTTTESREDGFYTFVRCDKTTNYENIKESIRKVKKNGFDYYLLRKNDTSDKVSVHPSPAIEKEENFSQSFFGNNKELIQILHNKKSISKSELARKKAIYLKSIASNESFNGLYLKAGASNNFGIDKSNYNLRLQWNIFGDGYLASESDMRKTLLKKELEYEQIMDEYQRLNLELSLYKMHAISNYINYYFLKEQKNILSTIINRSKRRFDASLITSDKYFKRKKRYEQIKQKLHYYESIEKEPYDISLKPIISEIEDITLADKKELSKYAYLNSYELKNREKEIALASIDNSWLNRIRTNLYVEKKKAVYLNDLDTVAGFQLQLPLDFNKDVKYRDIEIETIRAKSQLLKKLIEKNVDEIYSKIDYHKNYIKTLKNDIKYFQHEIKALKIEEKYPFGKQNRDPIYDKAILKLSISKHNHEIWQERTEILKLLLKLQNLTTVQVLP